MSPLHVSSFGGGVVTAGAADQRRIDELLEADSYEIGARGALVAASDVTDYLTVNDGAFVPAPWSKVHGLIGTVSGLNMGQVLAVGEGVARDNPASPYGPAYLVAAFNREGDASPVSGAMIAEVAATPAAPPQAPAVEGCVVSTVSFPGAFQKTLAAPVNIALVNIGAREGFAPNTATPMGLYVLTSDLGSTSFGISPIKDFDALGTGPFGEKNAGTKSKQLLFRAIVSYNNHVFGFGYDSADATTFDGPARVMFCNLGDPLKWGNDNIGAVGTDRLFTDSDAIVLGDAGEIIRGAIRIFGKLFFGTDRGLHYIAGYGRDSFLSDGATPVMKAFNTVGPDAMIEGPDKLLYGVSDQGLWSFDGVGVPNPLFLKLVDYAGHSSGWWDLIWTDPTRAAAGYPGRTNQDLVWTAVDWDRHQVLVGIPWCNVNEGHGFGEDTVVIKYHVQTGGFTRQVFRGVPYTAVGYFRRAGQQRETRFMATAASGEATIQRYGYKATASSAPVMSTALPAVTFGPYAPFGPDGRGSMKRVYLTMAWESAASLPITLAVTTTWDERTEDSFALTVGLAVPFAPATGDLWLDTSLADTNLGNATAGALTHAFPAALLKQWTGTVWRSLPGLGSNGTRATIRLPLEPRNGTRVTVRAACTAAAGRFQLEGLGEKPAGGSASE